MFFLLFNESESHQKPEKKTAFISYVDNNEKTAKVAADLHKPLMLSISILVLSVFVNLLKPIKQLSVSNLLANRLWQDRNLSLRLNSMAFKFSVQVNFFTYNWYFVSSSFGGLRLLHADLLGLKGLIESSMIHLTN